MRSNGAWCRRGRTLPSSARCSPAPNRGVAPTTTSRCATSPAPACRIPPSPISPSPAPARNAPANVFPADLVETASVSETAPAFERAEYAARLAKTRAAMDKAGIEVLIATDPSNMNWLTGYDGWSFYVHQAVIVVSNGEPLWFGRPIAKAAVRLTTVL